MKIETSEDNKSLRALPPVKRRLSRRGSGLIELAFVVLPLFGMLFGILDFCLAIYVKNTLFAAAREGVRFAVTQQTGASGQDAAIKAVIKQYSMGFLTDTAIANYVTIKYYNRDGSLFGTPPTGYGVGSNQGGNICVISITGFPYTFFMPLWRTPVLSFTATSSDAMEAPPNNILPAR